ncbi:MAG: LacI family DNA-binding transcriptional regulator [Sphaerochaetaceae bacterium]|nr:LacI family DNA-binding transcriptional regulator [Sphaerochaetaceae bacterium]
MKSSIKEVAHLAGVSIATVSYVLNGTKKVRPETEKRVLDSVRKLNYHVNPLARNLRKGESKLIGFVVSDFSNYFFQEIALGIEKQLAKSGYRLLLMDSKEQKETEVDNIKNMLAGAVDALIIAPTSEDSSFLRLLLANNPMPVVFVDRRPEGYETDTVLATNETGAYDAVKTLIDKGHTQIAFLGSRLDSTMQERLNGYRRALEESSIPVNANYIRFGSHESVSQRSLRHGIVYHHTFDLISNYDITAIFSANNLATVGVYSCIKETNLKVPQDIAFITFDDSFWLTMTTPAIAAVAQNPEEMGKVAANLALEKLLDSQSFEEYSFQEIRISTQFILRGSI